MITKLSKEDFEKTMGGKMIDITERENAVINIWNYVEEMVVEKIVLPLVRQEQLVEKVYRNQANTFDHVLLPTANADIFVVIVVDIIGKSILGHYLLNLNSEYGLSD